MPVVFTRLLDFSFFPTDYLMIIIDRSIDISDDFKEDKFYALKITLS